MNFCNMGCTHCVEEYCEKNKKKCSCCGEEFTVGELFIVNGENLCLRCKTMNPQPNFK